MTERFQVAENPDQRSQLRYRIRLPIDGGLVLKAREPWPHFSRVFCANDSVPWDDTVPLVDEADVMLCRRRGAAIDLMLDRPRLARCQLVFSP